MKKAEIEDEDEISTSHSHLSGLRQQMEIKSAPPKTKQQQGQQGIESAAGQFLKPKSNLKRQSGPSQPNVTFQVFQKKKFVFVSFFLCVCV